MKLMMIIHEFWKTYNSAKIAIKLQYAIQLYFFLLFIFLPLYISYVEFHLEY